MFQSIIQSRCVNLELNLSNLFIGEKSAALVANWIKNGDISISKLNLSQNLLGDQGLKIVARALSSCNFIYYVDIK